MFRASRDTDGRRPTGTDTVRTARGSSSEFVARLAPRRRGGPTDAELGARVTAIVGHCISNDDFPCILPGLHLDAGCRMEADLRSLRTSPTPIGLGLPTIVSQLAGRQRLVIRENPAALVTSPNTRLSCATVLGSDSLTPVDLDARSAGHDVNLTVRRQCGTLAAASRPSKYNRTTGSYFHITIVGTSGPCSEH